MPSLRPAMYVMSVDTNSEVKNLAVREWTCLNCHATQYRDLNAAKNLLKIGRYNFSGLEPPVELGDTYLMRDIDQEASTSK